MCKKKSRKIQEINIIWTNTALFDYVFTIVYSHLTLKLQD